MSKIFLVSHASKPPTKCLSGFGGMGNRFEHPGTALEEAPLYMGLHMSHPLHNAMQAKVRNKSQSRLKLVKDCLGIIYAFLILRENL
jgi:hypothetical protein